MSRWSSRVVVVAVAVVPLVGCDRKELEELPERAERQVEKVVPVVEDSLVTAKVKSALIAAPDLPGVSIEVETDANVVTLRGAVPSAEHRQRAERTARAVQGVKDVRNDLAVRP